jgi:hypothetical protein
VRGPSDAWGPGTRIPTLVVSPGLRGAFVVDNSEHDTTSIIATIEHRYGLEAGSGKPRRPGARPRERVYFRPTRPRRLSRADR